MIPAGEGWPQAWSQCVKEAAERDCTPEWLLWDELERARAQLAEAQRRIDSMERTMASVLWTGPVGSPGYDLLAVHKRAEAAEARERDLREKVRGWADVIDRAPGAFQSCSVPGCDAPTCIAGNRAQTALAEMRAQASRSPREGGA